MPCVIGDVSHVFVDEPQVDKTTGEIKPVIRVQIMEEIPLASGGYKFDLITIKCNDRRLAFESAVKKRVRVYVDTWGNNDKSGVFLLKGSSIELLDSKGVVIGLAEAPKGGASTGKAAS